MQQIRKLPTATQRSNDEGPEWFPALLITPPSLKGLVMQCDSIPTTRPLVYGSVCSGIEAATVAWHPLGWQPAFFSEIDNFPRAVLQHHYPNVPLHGDFTTIQEHDYDPIDLLVGGTPCQAFSVAGLRKGFADERGNLTLEFIRLAQRLKPRWLVWENVPGVLSIDGGRAFGSFLGGLAELGYGFAYRVLDAQHFGVPQRRRRVFVVGYLGDWRPPAAVLFEREGLLRDLTPSREAGKGTPSGFETGPHGGSFSDIAPTLDTRCKDGPIRNQLGMGVFASTSHALNAGSMKRQDPYSETLVAHALRGEGFDASEDGTGRGTPLVPVTAPTLDARAGRSGETSFATSGGLVPVAIQERAVCENPDAGPDGAGFRTDGMAYTLEARTVPQAVAFSCKDYGADAGGIAPTLRAMGYDASHANAGGQLAVAFDLRGREGGAQLEGPHHTANIRAASGGSSRSYIAAPMAVRRLTPRECERLQGFPDDYTLIPMSKRNKAAEQLELSAFAKRTHQDDIRWSADGPRYKALGNSMAVPCMRWIGERIEMIRSTINRRSAA